MKVYIGADHRGYTLKEQLKAYLKGYEVEDVGATQKDEDDDYPDVAKKVAEKIAGTSQSKGIVICGSGMGVDIVANKTKGIRSGIGFNPKQVKEAVQADNINVLALAADYTEPQLAKELAEAFLINNYIPEERRERRLKKIQQLEESD